MEPRGRREPPEYSFDPAVLVDWLGAPVAMLSQPPGLLHYASNESHSIGHQHVYPVAVTIEHRYDSVDHLAPGPVVMINVRTRWRQAQGEESATTPQMNVIEAIQDHMTDSAAQAGVRRSRSQRLPALVGWSWREVLVADVPTQWEYVILPDVTTDEEVIGIGGAVGEMLVAVVGPMRLLARIGLRFHHPQ